MAASLLLLFDIDGTLLQRASSSTARALREAAGAVHGRRRSTASRSSSPGRTDAAIARDLLRSRAWRAGASTRAPTRCATRRGEPTRSCARPTCRRVVAPGMPELLDELAARPDDVPALARHRQPRADRAAEARRAPASARYFERGQGGFGSDSEDRAELPAIARARGAGPPWPRERTVVIGDTPRDIACARADGVRVAAVATGPFAVEALADADAVVDDARALLPVLDDWADCR